MSLELKIIEKEVGKLAINYDEFKAELLVQLEQFKGLVVTENAISEAKSKRAGLNKVAKIIDDRKKELKKEFLKPYELVDTQAKELIGLINEVNSAIDFQIKEFEELEKNTKKNEIISLWDFRNYHKVSLEQLWDDKWLNKTVSLKNIDLDLETKIAKIENDLSNIDGLVEDKNVVLTLQSKYLINLDLNKTLFEYHQEIERSKILKEQSSVREEPSPVEVKSRTAETEIGEEEKVYTLQFEIVGTKDEIMKLSEFLKSNNYKYRKL